MTGAILRSGPLARNTDSSSAVSIYGADARDNGASLYLFGKDHPYNGMAIIRARGTSGADKDLAVGSDGTLSFAGQRLSAFCHPYEAPASLTLGASGTAYTAPDDGWIILSKNAGAASEYIYLNALAKSTVYAPAAGANLVGYIPVFRGQDFYINYTASGVTNFFNFVKALGATVRG